MEPISPNPPADLAARLCAYMQAKNIRLFYGKDEFNIIYVEGINPDGTENADADDGWNDLRVVLEFVEYSPQIVHAAVATTEPGRLATLSDAAKARGGVARIAFGQYSAWRLGYHNIRKNNKNHPALVQAAPLPVHRDRNRDGKRTGDLLHLGMFGINQHGTRPGYRGDTVANWSEGCLVGMDWEDHLAFIDLLRHDGRYVADPQFLFTTTVIAGDELYRMFPPPPPKPLT